MESLLYAAALKGPLLVVLCASSVALIAAIYALAKGCGGPWLDLPLSMTAHTRRRPRIISRGSLDLPPVCKDPLAAERPGSRSSLLLDSGHYLRNLLGEVADMCENLSRARRGT